MCVWCVCGCVCVCRVSVSVCEPVCVCVVCCVARVCVSVHGRAGTENPVSTRGRAGLSGFLSKPRQSTSNRRQIGRAFFRACRWARGCPRAPPLGNGALRPNWGSGGRRRGASDKQHGQSAATEHARRARASWAAVDRVRPGALKLGGSAPGAREEAGAARAWGWPRALLHIGPRVDWAALTSPRPEAGT